MLQYSLACSLTVDEMALKKHVQFVGKKNIVIVMGSSFLAGLVVRNYLMAIACSHSEVSQRIVVTTVDQSLPFEVAAASEGS